MNLPSGESGAHLGDGIAVACPLSRHIGAVAPGGIRRRPRLGNDVDHAAEDADAKSCGGACAVPWQSTCSGCCADRTRSRSTGAARATELKVWPPSRHRGALLRTERGRGPGVPQAARASRAFAISQAEASCCHSSSALAVAAAFACSRLRAKLLPKPTAAVQTCYFVLVLLSHQLRKVFSDGAAQGTFLGSPPPLGLACSIDQAPVACCVSGILTSSRTLSRGPSG